MFETIKNPEEFKKFTIEGNQRIYKAIKDKDPKKLILEFLTWYEKAVRNEGTEAGSDDFSELMENLWFIFLSTEDVNHFSGFKEIVEPGGEGFVFKKFKKTFLAAVKDYIIDYEFEEFNNLSIAEEIIKKVSGDEKSKEEIKYEIKESGEAILADIYEESYEDFIKEVERVVDDYKNKDEDEILEELEEKGDIRLAKKLNLIENVFLEFVNTAIKYIKR